MVDLTIEEEIIAMVQELIQIENHSERSFQGSRNEKWLKVKNRARQLRTKWMEKIFVDEDKTQKWCAEKHILDASKRLTEVGTKYLSAKDEETCKEALMDSAEVLGMYYFLNDKSKNNFFKKLIGGKKCSNKDQCKKDQ